MIWPKDSDLFPAITGEVFDAIAADKEWQEIEINRCAEEPWYWLVNYCWTIRRDDEGSYVERVPPKDYLRLVAQDWYENPLYMLSKSRQMMATWLLVLLHLHTAMFFDNIHICCQTKKEDDADSEMIQRAHFAFGQFPIWMRKYSPAKYSFCKLYLTKTKSLLRGIPAGGDQIRSHNPNYLLSDEFAFQPEAEESYTAALACCQRLTLVSSANPGFMDDLVHERVKVAV